MHDGENQRTSRGLDCQTPQPAPSPPHREFVQNSVLIFILPFTTSFMIAGKLHKLCEPNFCSPVNWRK